MQAVKLINFHRGFNQMKFQIKSTSALNILQCRSLYFTRSQNFSISDNMQKSCLLPHCTLFQRHQIQGTGSCLFSGLDHSKSFKVYHNSQEKETEKVISEEPEKLSLVKRYKKMLKEYWYVLIPVHIATSSMWFGIFYYAATCGFDIVPFLEMLGVTESIIRPLRNSSLGYIAVASALYKLATPARYMVTLGVSTVTVKYLTKRGYLKPVPSKDKLKTMIKTKLHGTKDIDQKEK